MNRLTRIGAEDQVKAIAEVMRTKLDNYDLVLIANLLCMNYEGELSNTLRFVNMTTVGDMLEAYNVSYYQALAMASKSTHFDINDRLVCYDDQAHTLTSSASYDEAAKTVAANAEAVAKVIVAHDLDLNDLLTAVGSDPLDE